jgi:hypothetical protein
LFLLLFLHWINQAGLSTRKIHHAFSFSVYLHLKFNELSMIFAVALRKKILVNSIESNL